LHSGPSSDGPEVRLPGPLRKRDLMHKQHTHGLAFVRSVRPLVVVLLAVLILSSGCSRTEGTRGGSTKPAAFYVAPTGNDSNKGTLVAPFLTLERARDAMRASSTTKTVFLRAGSYARTTTLVLTSADDGETWQYYPPEGVDTAILDGGAHASHTGVDVLLIQGASNITIDGLQIQNSDNYGIGIHGGAPFEDQFAGPVPPASGDAIVNNVIHDGYTWHTQRWAGGGVWFEGQVKNLVVRNNVVYNQYGSAIRGCANPDGDTPTDDLSGLDIEDNAIYDVDTIVKDNGAIYTEDRTGKKSTHLTIKNNYVRDWSRDAPEDRGIYLDDGTSNATVTGNVVGPPGKAARGTASLLISSGSNNTVSGNIFDLGTSGKDSLMIHYNMPGSRNAMTNNTFQGNVVIMSFAGRQSTEFFAPGVSYQADVGSGAAQPASPNCRNNVYHNYAGGQERTDGNRFGDRAPIHTDPQLSGWAYSVTPGSPILKAPVNFQGGEGCWGPPGFKIPQTGTPPSCPH